jgi:hypothetical protein
MKGRGTVAVALLLSARVGLAQTRAPDDVKVGDVIWAPPIAEPERSVEPDQAKPEATPKRWYGEPILVADSTAYTCLLLAAAFDMKETHQVFIPPALVAYTLAGPITHAAHGNWGRASASLAIRLGTPLATLMLGAAGCTADSGDCPETLLVFGAIGMVAASAIDVAALAREAVPPRPPRVAWTPTLSLSRERATIGAVAQF